jgi:hypothetical protein
MVQSMKDEALSLKNRRRGLALSIGLFLFSIYLFSYRGGFHSVDEVAMFAVTENLAKVGRFNIDQIAWIQWTTSQAEAQGFFGQDGHVYSKKGLALSLAQVPLYWLALYLPGIGMLQTVSLLNALISATTGLLIFMFLHRLNFSTFTAVTTSLIFGLATIAAVYAKYLFSEPLAGFLLLLAAYMLFAYRQEGGLRHVAIAGLAAGFAVLTRANNLFTLPVFGFYLIWIVWQHARFTHHASRITPPKARKRHASRFTFHVSRLTFHKLSSLPFASFLPPLLVFVLTTAIAGIILLAYNAIRSGNPLETGYELTLFSPNVLLGLYKLLFSPLRGLFVYSPVLLLSLPGWWSLRQTRPAEAWLFAGLAGVTIALFSAWSSGEGLSWGSRFLVPIVPFFAISLAPVVERVSSVKCHVSRVTCHVSRVTPHASRLTFHLLLSLSLLIQLLGLVINPWVFLGRLQANFGGEFFLENTAALYDFRYSQIVGQIESWSLKNSDLAWWQPWGFDGLAFGLSLGLVLLTSWLFWRSFAGRQTEINTPLALRSFALPFLVTTLITYLLLARYYHTDRQFGPPNDAYTQALNTVVAERNPDDPIVTVAQNHYHLPMNRFKARVPLTGFARQEWPPPKTALPLLKEIATGPNIWLITIGFQPAAAHNATEQWLTLNTFKISDKWLGEDVRRVRYTARQPTITRAVDATLGQAVQLVQVSLIELLQPGQTLPVEFVWLPLTRPQVDYNLFLQLLGADGTLVAQHDSPSNGGYSPTSTWSVGKAMIAHHALALPSDLQPGDYRLIAGLYNPATGQRLSLAEGNDFVELGNIEIQASVAPLNIHTSNR